MKLVDCGLQTADLMKNAEGFNPPSEICNPQSENGYD